MVTLIDIGIGLLIVATAFMIFSIGLKLIKENTKKD